MAQITRWKRKLRQQAAQVFAETPVADAAVAGVQPLYGAIGRLQMENALLKNGGAMSVAQQRTLVAKADPTHSVQAPLPGARPLAQQFLLPALRGKRV